MDGVIPILLAIAIPLGGWCGWIIARRFGLWPGLALPAVAIGGALIRSAIPLGHPEEAMGRGFEVLLFWVPLSALTVIGAALGLIMRWRSRKRHRPG